MQSLDYKPFHCKKALCKAASDLPPRHSLSFMKLKSTSNGTVLTCYHVLHCISSGTLTGGFSITLVTQAGRLVKIKLNPEAISHLSVGGTDQVCILHVNRPQISIFACLCLHAFFLITTRSSRLSQLSTI